MRGVRGGVALSPPDLSVAATSAVFFPSVALSAGRDGDFRGCVGVRVGVKKNRPFWRNFVFLC